MPQTTVSSCVLSIITSFSSGLDVFKKLKGSPKTQKQLAKKTERKASDREIRLGRSLRQGPEDIGREYQRNVQALGDDFATGDSNAQSALAEVLLRLNTGLVNIIDTFLSRRQKGSEVEYETLTLLSDQCRVDTCRTLRQLYRRMIRMRVGSHPSLSQQSLGVGDKGRPRIRETDRSDSNASQTNQSKKKSNTAKHPKTRGPVLARVVIQNSVKPSQIALVKPGERRKKASRPSASPRLHSMSSPALSGPALLPPSPSLIEAVADAESHLPRLARPLAGSENPSSADIGPLILQAQPERGHHARSTSSLNFVSEQQTQPEPTFRTSLPERTRRRKETPTYYSIASGSTQIGEIPLHRWAESYDFDAMSVLNREAAKNGWPVDNSASSNERKKPKLGIFRMFRRQGSRA